MLKGETKEHSVKKATEIESRLINKRTMYSKFNLVSMSTQVIVFFLIMATTPPIQKFTPLSKTATSPTVNSSNTIP